MKARKLILLILVFSYFSANSILPWGFFAHKRVNKYAVFTLPEDYNYLVGTAQYKYSVLDFAWETVESSHAALDSVLSFDKILSETFEKDKQYSYEKRGAKTINVRSEDFSAAYHDMLDGMVERRMRKTIISIGSLWYSEWVDAGQPVLDGMKNSETLFTEEIKIDHKITEKDARGHQH